MGRNRVEEIWGINENKVIKIYWSVSREFGEW
jgi:hypothetical protein